MGQSDFKDYTNASKLLQFSLIPYTKVYQLHKFTNTTCIVSNITFRMETTRLKFEENMLEERQLHDKRYQTE